MPQPDASPVTRDLLAFIDASPTPFHAVEQAGECLRAAGFELVDEGEPWSLSPGDRRFVVRNGSTLAAFVVGEEPPAESGFRMVGAHVDSPNLRLKPRPERQAERCLQLAVEPYGGLLMASWADRDLSVAGRLVLRDGSERLVKVDRPLCRIPQLAIHLNRKVNEEGLKLDAQRHLPPLIGLAGEAAEEGWLAAFVAGEAGVAAEELAGFDLMLFDVVPSCVSGLEGEFVHAPRLDNLASCHAALAALIDRSGEASARTRVIVLHDHEEVGSRTAEGAESAFLPSLLERVVGAAGGSREDYHRAVTRSLCVSADMAHAVHPSHPDVHEPGHLPRMNGGPVIKTNANARYATNAATAAAFRELARAADVPVQEFVTRSDLACGSTIGPVTAARLGVPVVDVGSAMLSMHSIREMAGSRDQELMIRVLRRLFD